MAEITKTQGVSLLSIQSVSSGDVAITSVVDVSTKLAATIFIFFGRMATTALTVGCRFRIEASSSSSGNNWIPLTTFQTNVETSEEEAVTGTVNSGQKVITVDSTTNLTVGDIIFISNTTIGDSEWHRIKSVVTNTSVTVEDDLANAQTGATIFDRAELYVAQLDLTSIGRIRVVVDNTGTGQQVAAKIEMVTGDSIG